MAGEFELIRQRFTRPTRHTTLGVGDDAALLRAAPGMQLVVSTDMLVAGTHFLPEASPYDIGWKTAAVNISDMAAMAAAPRWIVLALSLPAVDESWCEQFAAGFWECCQRFDVDWVGGDTTRGPLNLCATVFGEVPEGAAVLRSGARAGDDIWISGEPGLAALGLQHVLGRLALAPSWREVCSARLHRPLPRVALGCALRSVASAMLDVSDGLAGDLRHILEQSNVGAELFQTAMPLDGPTQACGDAAQAQHAVLAGGDDYELLFTAPTEQRWAIGQMAAQLALPLTRIGHITDQSQLLTWQSADGSTAPLHVRGYDHFS